MTEPVKTAAFLAAGAVAIAAAYFFDSSAKTVDVQQYVGQFLVDDIDVTAPHRLQIVKFDRQTASVRQFEVAEVDGVWSIPSKQNYPADATQQMAEAVTCLMGRKILRIAGDSAQAHESQGVIDPLSAKLDTNSRGVGTRVTMTDADGATLVDVIIGKAVKDAPTQRYVRRSSQDVVYIVELDPKKLSTNFSDWIEDDLLKLSVMDLRKAFVNDYTATLSIMQTPEGFAPRIGLEPRSEITLARKDDADPWAVAEMKKFDPARADDPQLRGMVEDKLADDEEVNQDTVRDLVNGLDELLIVDIAKKPAGLSADLKAGDAFLNEEEAVSDLVRKGFLPGRHESGADMLSSEGELVCTLRNGVEYVLRFGKLQVQTEHGAGGEAEESVPPAPAADAAAEQGKADGENLRRYLFVMARFNEEAVERPQYKELPTLPAAESGEEASAADAENAENADQSGADETGDSEAGADSTPSEGADGSTTADDAKADEASGEDPKAEEQKADDAKPDREKILAERKSIEDENARLRTDYESLISSGQEEVAKLNERFGDWYFVISNDVFKRIHLGRDQVIKKKDPPAATGDGAAPVETPQALSGLPEIGGAPSAPATGNDGASADQPEADANPGSSEPQSSDQPDAEDAPNAIDEPASASETGADE